MIGRDIILFLVLTNIFMQSIFAQQTDEKKMQEYMMLAIPGEEHAMLAQLEGEWEQEYRFFMTPNTESMISKGKSIHKMILDGRFLQMNAEGEMMGQKIESLTILGFDKRFKVFTIYGFDTMGTYAVNAEGSYSADTKTITYKGKNFEPSINDYSNYRMTFVIENENEYVFELYFTFPEKEEMKMLEMIGKRIK